MARSEIIYVALDPYRLSDPASFTVRHELITWLGNHEKREHLIIWRCQDGPRKDRTPVRIPLAELGFPA